MKIKYNVTAYKRAVAALLLLCACTTSLLAQSTNPFIAKDTTKGVVYELYGKRNATYVTSSISTLNADKIARNSVASFGNALYGRIPGLSVRQANGEPGNDYPTLFVRGKHTFTGSNAPLVLVDGFPRDFHTLSVDEVESVSVLKDAASTAIFGMDGANGIIMVTTKRGIKQRTSVGFKAEYGLMSPTRLPEFYGSYKFASFYTDAEKNDGKTVFKYSPETIEAYRDKLDNMLYPDVNWMKEAIREVTPTQNYTLDVRGGNDIATFYVNLGYTNTEGLFKEIGDKDYSSNNKLDMITFRSNIDVKISKALTMSIDLSGRLENVNASNNSSSSIWQNLYTFHPNSAPIYAAPGVWGGNNTYRNNPLAYINDVGYRHTHRRLLQTNMGFDYDLSSLVKNLSIGVKGSIDNFYSAENGFSKTYAVREVVGFDEYTGKYLLNPTVFGINGPLTPFGPSNEAEIRSNAFEAYLRYNVSLNKHVINAKALYHQDSKEMYRTKSDLAGTPDRRISIGAQVSYAFDNKYLVDVAASYGGGENFMKGKRFGLFPAISGAWIISNEKFMKQNDIIDLLKVRASTGIVGNQDVGGTRFGYRTLYVADYGYSEGALGNPNLTWEKSFKTDIGVDASILKHLNLSVTYFHEYRTDILNSGESLLPDFVGIKFDYFNYGRVRAQGVEASVNYNYNSKDWGFNTTLHATNQKNKIVQISETVRNYAYLYRQGHPIGQRFMLIADGFYSKNDVENRGIAQSWGNVIPGSLKYKDINGNNIVDSDDYQAVGHDADIPKWELGFNLGAHYKGLYFDAYFQAAIGRDINLREEAPYVTSALYYDRNISTFIKQPWTAEIANDPAKAGSIDFPSLTLENNTNNFQNSTFFMRNGDFLRLRSLEVGYKLPMRWIKHVGLQSANIYLRGMNLFTLDHLKFFDPEVLEGYPVLKSYNVGINLTF